MKEGTEHRSSFLSWIVQVNHKLEFNMNSMDTLQRMKGPALAMAFCWIPISDFIVMPI